MCIQRCVTRQSNFWRTNCKVQIKKRWPYYWPCKRSLSSFKQHKQTIIKSYFLWYATKSSPSSSSAVVFHTEPSTQSSMCELRLVTWDKTAKVLTIWKSKFLKSLTLSSKWECFMRKTLLLIMDWTLSQSTLKKPFSCMVIASPKQLKSFLKRLLIPNQKDSKSSWSMLHRTTMVEASSNDSQPTESNASTR